MPTRISALFGVESGALEATGAFDGFVDIDSRLYVDPHLLDASTAPELATSRDLLNQHFHEILTILRRSRERGDLFWRRACQRLLFPEIRWTGLGLAKKDTGGRGIGRALAERLTDLAREIIEAGIEDPEIFDLVGLIEKGIGADRISDMVVSIALPAFLRFSERVAAELDLSVAEFESDRKTYRLPSNPTTGEPVILVPRDVLSDIPIAESWEDVDRIHYENERVRQELNERIGETWRTATQATAKAELRNVLVRHPQVLRDLLDQYREKPKTPYDFERDRSLILAWQALTLDLPHALPLNGFPTPLQTPEDLHRFVELVVDRFRTAVEDNRLSRLLYNDDESARHEKIAQLAFFGTAVAYCEAYNVDITPEADGGSGPVDFKFSRGFRARVVVEMKLSSNPNLLHAFHSQIRTYARAENGASSFLLVVLNGRGEPRVRDLLAAARDERETGAPTPAVVVVDGRLRPAATRRDRAPARRRNP